MAIARRTGATLVATILVLVGCDGGDDDGDADDAVTSESALTIPDDLTTGGDGIGGDAGDDAGQLSECPLLSTEEVEEVMEREMESTLRFDTVCEWLAEEDSAISASIAEITQSEFESGNGPVVQGIGDEAHLGALGLRFRVGDAYYEASASDINGTSGLDEDGAAERLARAVVENVGQPG